MKPSVTVLLRGGLGNQLSCLYAAKYVATKFNLPLIADGRLIKFGGNPERKLEVNKLNLFNIDPEVIYKHAFPLPKSRIGRFSTRKLQPLIAKALLKNEGGEIYDDKSDLTRIPKSEKIILDGYFPTSDYFQELNAKNQLAIPSPKNPSVRYITKLKMTNNLIGVHVRLGDYLIYKDIYPICSEMYFMSAIKEISEKELNYMVFTEDKNALYKFYPNLAKKAIDIVDDKNLNTVETFSLMSHMTHLVIANSSFSTWAATFVDLQGGKVVCPDKFTHLNDTDHRPKNWQRLDIQTGQKLISDK